MLLWCVVAVVVVVVVVVAQENRHIIAEVLSHGPRMREGECSKEPRSVPKVVLELLWKLVQGSLNSPCWGDQTMHIYVFLCNLERCSLNSAFFGLVI